MIRLRTTAMLALCACLLTSCWDEHSIQETSYFTAIGIDYLADQRQYVVEATLITLSDVAKSEGNNSKAFPTYVGRGEGESIHLALEHIYKSTQLLPSLDHLMTIVIRDRALDKLGDILESMNRSRTVRYNVHILATKEPIGDVLQSDTFFNSPMYTFLYSHGVKGPAKPPIAQQSMQTLVREYYEPSRTSMLPNLALDRTSWRRGGKNPIYLYFKGAYALGTEAKPKFIDDDVLKGTKWFYTDPKGTFLEVREKGRLAGILIVSDNKHRIRFDPAGVSGRFRIELDVEAYIYELHVRANEAKLRDWAAAGVREELQAALDISRSQQVDLFNLENIVYKRDVKTWKKMKAAGTNISALPCDVQIRVSIKNTGKLKLK